MGAILHAVQEHSLLLAVLLPPAIRIVGHWLPEEPLMVAMGMLAARSGPDRAAAILGLLWLSHAATDHAVFSLGRLLSPHLERWPRVARRVRPVADRIAASRWALAALVGVRALPLARGAWLLGFGVAGVRRSRFAVADGAGVTTDLLLWCGLGWWLGARMDTLLPVARPAALWLLLAVVASAAAVTAWRHLPAGARRRPSP